MIILIRPIVAIQQGLAIQQKDIVIIELPLVV